MKALRAQNIVHRDLKPGNILIKFHPRTGKMQVGGASSRATPPSTAPYVDQASRLWVCSYLHR